jgi:mRNA interferase MazF
VLAALQGDDIVLCQITSQAKSDQYSIRLDSSDFVSGGLNQSSWIRPNRLFTADAAIVRYRAGRISEAIISNVIGRLIEIFTQG